MDICNTYKIQKYNLPHKSPHCFVFGMVNKLGESSRNWRGDGGDGGMSLCQVTACDMWQEVNFRNDRLL